MGLPPTPPNPTGPAYRPGAPLREDLALGQRGRALLLSGRVLRTDGTPIPGAVLDVWHASAWGCYDLFSRQMRYRGRVRVGEDGTFRIRTVRPGGYLWRPPHVHLHVCIDGRRALTTQLYLPGDLRLRLDSAVREALILQPTEIPGGSRASFDLVLSG